MTTDFHDAFADGDGLTIAEIKERFDALDAAIASQVAAAVTVKVAVLYDSKSTTTAGGASSATTWNTRVLNTKNDPDEIVTLSSNQFTPVSGSYVIMVRSPAYNVDVHRLRLYNVTQASTVKLGVDMDAPTNGNFGTLKYRITANGTDAYRVDHYTETAQASNGLGRAVGDGSNEVYTHVVLIKVG